MHLFQCLHEHLLPVRKEVRVDIHGGGNVLVPDALRDGDCREPLVDEQGYMGVSDVVDADRRHAALFAAVFQMVFQKIDGARDDALILFQPGIPDIVHDFGKEKVRHRDVADAVLRFWR